MRFAARPTDCEDQPDDRLSPRFAESAKAVRKPLALLMTLTLSLAGASLAEAELTAKGDLLIRFGGGISPQALPRSEPAPIAVRIEGSIRTTNRDDPPALGEVRIALNRGGTLNARGLPICRRPEIDPANPSKALAICGEALVGGGGFSAVTSLPDQPQAVVHGEILLFNSADRGRPAILAHVYQANPGPIIRFIVFHISHAGGAYGTIITGQLPSSLTRDGYLKSIYLQLQRRYSFRGRSRSYLSASCPAPAGFTKAVFSFARASMSFADGRTLASDLIRTCSVRSP
jgi:hypothetical protein